MASRIKYLLREKIFEYLNLPKSTDLPYLHFERDVTSGQFFYELPLKTQSFAVKDENKNILQSLSLNETSNDIANEIHIKQKNNIDYAYITIDKNSYIKNFLESNISKIDPPPIKLTNEKIVVEFSSPNIAKPFHVGHLRSTIIGNYIANLHKYFSDTVVKLNYLGDWGTQLGLLKIGMESLKMDIDHIKTNPMIELYKAYVHANELASTNLDINSKAREIFKKLEHGDEEYLKKWEFLKSCTKHELDKTYNRLGITFDEYHWESMYSLNRTEHIAELIENLGFLSKDIDGRYVIRLDEDTKIPLIKSDGSSLYLYRDIAAAIDRAQKYKFNKMYYVVANAQHEHFLKLFGILDRIGMSWANKLHHIKFGNIHGMSTRKGTVVFLTDILDEASAVLKEKQINSPRTKVSPDLNDNSSDILGMSAIIVHDLKQRKLRDYQFSWNMALDVKGESGVKLQYTHCRLCSLEENCGAEIVNKCDPDLLNEPIVYELVTIMSQFDEAIILSYDTLEACCLTKYLFHLSHVINKTLEQLRVKGEPPDIASQRLLLLRVARNFLNTGMKLLGLTPLNKM